MSTKNSRKRKRRRKRNRRKGKKSAGVRPAGRFVKMRRLKRKMNTVRLEGVMGSLISGVVGTGLLAGTLPLEGVLAAGVLAAVAGYFIPMKWLKKDLVGQYKSDVLKPFLQQRFRGLNYQPKFACDFDLVKASCLFHVGNPSMEATDGLFGKVKGFELQAMDLKVYSRLGGDRNNLLYQGIFAMTTYPKNVQAGVLVFSKDYPLAPGTLSELNWDDDFTKVQLELGAFNDAFEVWTTNEVESAFALPIPFQEQLVTIHKKVENGLGLSIVGDQLSVTFGSDTDLFEPNPDDFADKSVLEESARQLQEVAEVLKMLSQMGS